MGIWPSYTNAEINIPKDLASQLDIFKEFYMSKHNGRCLTWQHSLDTCVIRAEFSCGKKELAVSLYQALVLLLFDHGKDSLTYQEIVQSTNIGKTKTLLLWIP